MLDRDNERTARGAGVSLRCAPGRASRAVGHDTTVPNGAEPPSRQVFATDPRYPRGRAGVSALRARIPHASVRFLHHIATLAPLTTTRAATLTSPSRLLWPLEPAIGSAAEPSISSPRAVFRALACAAALAVASATAACAQAAPAPDPCPFAAHAPRMAPGAQSPADRSRPWFHAVPGWRLGDPGADAFRNADPEATPRIVRAATGRVDTAAYRTFRRRVAPLLERWGRDPRLGINPALVAALIAKESGFDPRAVSSQAALGYAQLTFAADSDLRVTAGADSASGWMCREVTAWPRDPAWHAGPSAAEPVRARVAAGTLNPSTEYLLDPRSSARAAVLWLRLLEVAWTETAWPGMYGDSVRARLNGGAPLTEDQLVDLVLASYNHGYPEVWALVRAHGPAWRDHLPPEPRDYVERIRAYTVLFQRGRR